MSLAFRNGSAADLPEVARLARHSFPGVARSLEEWVDHLSEFGGGLDTLLLAEEDARLVGACKLIPYRQWIGGVAVPIMGLSTVAIAPTARRRGIAGEMVAFALRRARERGDLASLLYPFRTRFYQNLGYGLAGVAHQYVVPPQAFSDDPGRARVQLVRTEEERREIARLYDAWAPTQTGQLARPREAWSRVWQDDTRDAVVYRSEKGEAEGYLVFRYLLEDPGRAMVDVEEGAWLLPAAQRALHGWLSSLGDQWDLVAYRAHPRELFPEHLRELRYPPASVPRWHFWFPAAVLMNGPMFRLLDFQRAWQERPVQRAAPMTVRLTVRDPLLGANDGAWTLRFEDGRVAVSPGDAASDVELELEIDTLSRIYIGALRPSEAARGGLVQVDRPERLALLDQLLSIPEPWTFDRF